MFQPGQHQKYYTIFLLLFQDETHTCDSAVYFRNFPLWVPDKFSYNDDYSFNTKFVEDNSLTNQVRVRIDYYTIANDVSLERTDNEVYLNYELSLIHI